jgi:hypothetical protein
VRNCSLPNQDISQEPLHLAGGATARKAGACRVLRHVGLCVASVHRHASRSGAHLPAPGAPPARTQARGRPAQADASTRPLLPLAWRLCRLPESSVGEQSLLQRLRRTTRRWSDAEHARYVARSGERVACSCAAGPRFRWGAGALTSCRAVVHAGRRHVWLVDAARGVLCTQRAWETLDGQTRERNTRAGMGHGRKCGIRHYQSTDEGGATVWGLRSPPVANRSRLSHYQLTPPWAYTSRQSTVRPISSLRRLPSLLHRAVLGFVPCERLAAECRHPTGRERMGSPTLKTLQDPILPLPWVCFRGGGFPNPQRRARRL